MRSGSINLQNRFYVADGGSKYMHYNDHVINASILVFNKGNLSLLEIGHWTEIILELFLHAYLLY